MLKWLTRDPAKSKLVAERIAEAAREIGILLIAFTPLDFALSDHGVNVPVFAAFIIAGIGLFVLGIAIEWRLK